MTERLRGQVRHPQFMSSEASSLTIDVPKLRRVLDALLSDIESHRGSLIEIDRDHYWLLELRASFAEDLRQPSSDSDELGVGQISDDVATVAALARDIEHGGASLSPWHDLEHSVGLLRALAWLDLP